jgi:hypothetical protein
MKSMCGAYVTEVLYLQPAYVTEVLYLQPAYVTEVLYLQPAVKQGLLVTGTNQN